MLSVVKSALGEMDKNVLVAVRGAKNKMNLIVMVNITGVC
jgi:hypothetical protein